MKCLPSDVVIAQRPRLSIGSYTAEPARAGRECLRCSTGLRFQNVVDDERLQMNFGSGRKQVNHSSVERR